MSTTELLARAVFFNFPGEPVPPDATDKVHHAHVRLDGLCDLWEPAP